jgi:hypothetical protein
MGSEENRRSGRSSTESNRLESREKDDRAHTSGSRADALPGAALPHAPDAAASASGRNS